MKLSFFRRPAADKNDPLPEQAAAPPVGGNAASPLQPALARDDGRWSGRGQRWQERREHLLESMAVGLGSPRRALDALTRRHTRQNTKLLLATTDKEREHYISEKGADPTLLHPEAHSAFSEVPFLTRKAKPPKGLPNPARLQPARDESEPAARRALTAAPPEERQAPHGNPLRWAASSRSERRLARRTQQLRASIEIGMVHEVARGLRAHMPVNMVLGDAVLAGRPDVVRMLLEDPLADPNLAAYGQTLVEVAFTNTDPLVPEAGLEIIEAVRSHSQFRMDRIRSDRVHGALIYDDLRREVQELDADRLRRSLRQGGDLALALDAARRNEDDPRVLQRLLQRRPELRPPAR